MFSRALLVRRRADVHRLSGGQVLEHSDGYERGHLLILRVGQVFRYCMGEVELHLLALPGRHVLLRDGGDERGGVLGVSGEFKQLSWV
jgi:hypothetical protein